MKKTFVVATDQLDSQGDIIKLGGVKIANKVWLTKEFKHNEPPLGMCSIENTGNKLIATAEVPDNVIGLTPAIGFKVIESHRENSIRVLDKIELIEVSLCSVKNHDELIKPIE